MEEAPVEEEQGENPDRDSQPGPAIIEDADTDPGDEDDDADDDDEPAEASDKG